MNQIPAEKPSRGHKRDPPPAEGKRNYMLFAYIQMYANMHICLYIRSWENICYVHDDRIKVRNSKRKSA